MAEESISQEIRSKEIDKTRNYFLEEIKQNELISKKHKKVCKISAITIKISVITAEIKKYKSIIKKKEKKHDKIAFSAKINLNTIKVLISKALIDLNISHDEFVSVVNNMLNEHDDTKDEIKNSSNKINKSFTTI